jgi:hypothetical protein
MKYLSFLAITLLVSSCSATFIPTEVQNGKLLGIMLMKHGKVTYQYTSKLQTSRVDIFRQSPAMGGFSHRECAEYIADRG